MLPGADGAEIEEQVAGELRCILTIWTEAEAEADMFAPPSFAVADQ